MIQGVGSIRMIDMLCRVSTRAQENEGDSLFNQRREIKNWAESHGITIRREIELTESGKQAVRLNGGAFVFNRRAQYTEVIVEYQTMKRDERPGAIVVDWVDRWSRSVLEYNVLVVAFRELGIRLLAIGDGLDLTDPENELVTNVRASIGQEQLRIIKKKIGEARRSRRERGKWQGGHAADGYRTHEPDCAGLSEISRETDGKMRAYKVRSCNCPPVVLRRDPAREVTIAEIWRLLDTSSLTWQGMADELNTRGFRRPSGAKFRWHDLYRIGMNPHYAGIMTSDTYVRDPYANAWREVRRLEDQQLKADTDCIPDPYITQDLFWDIYRRRFSKETRFQKRAKRGSSSELTGLLFCPECDRLMSSRTCLDTKRPSVPPDKRRRYILMECSHSRGSEPSCTNRQRVRVDWVGRKLIERLADLTVMSDSAIAAAMQLRQSNDNRRALEAEHRRLVEAIRTAENARHELTKLLASGAMTQSEVEADLFEHRRDRTQAQTRIAEVERELRQTETRADFDQARTAIGWLRDQWALLTVKERAETLRLLVERVTYVPSETPYPKEVRVARYGRAFVESSHPSSLPSLQGDGAFSLAP